MIAGIRQNAGASHSVRKRFHNFARNVSNNFGPIAVGPAVEATLSHPTASAHTENRKVRRAPNSRAVLPVASDVEMKKTPLVEAKQACACSSPPAVL